jgi:translation elongation factor EF-Ts
MTAIRTFAYTHSDSATPGKASAIVRVACTSDFAARTRQIDVFLARIATRACAAGMLAPDDEAADWAAGAKSWADVVRFFGPAGEALDAERVALAEELQEPVEVDFVCVVRAADLG